MELEERVAVLEEQMRVASRERDELRAAIDGPPWERSVRGRMHTLEAESAAAKAAGAALAEAQAERRRFHAERNALGQQRVHWRWKAVAAATAAAIAAAPYVQMFWGS